MRTGEQTDGISPEESASTLGVSDQSTSRFNVDDYEPEENESATETARRISALLKEEDDSDGDEGSDEQQPEATQKVSESEEGNPEQIAQETPAQAAQRVRDEKGKFVAKPKNNDPELEPPAGLKPEFKKAFLNMPEGLKRETHRLFRDQQAHFTRTQQQLKASLQQSEGIITTAKSYIQNNNLTDSEGKAYTEDRLFRELLAAHDNISKNPDYYLAQMIKSTGADRERIAAYLNGETPSGVDLGSDPNFRAVQSELNSVKEELRQYREGVIQSRIAPAAEQFSAVMREIDPASGEYRFPELHDDVFLESTKPLVAALLRTNPTLGHGEALKRAWSTLTGRGYSNNQLSPSAPARSNNLERARSAAVSVRGRVAPVGSGQSNINDLDLDEIPQSASETARMIYNRLRG